MMRCRFCGAATNTVLSFEAVTPLQNRFFASREEAAEFPLIPLDVSVCECCGHVHIGKDSVVEFDESYNNEQSGSTIASTHMAIVADHLTARLTDHNAKIVEIGCGRGEFLGILAERGYAGVQGYDPVAGGQTDYISSTYWSGASDGDIDLFVLRHTLEEIPDPHGFAEEMAASLSPRGLVYCEITNADRVTGQFDAFSVYPECTNIFSLKSLHLLLRKFGIELQAVWSFFDGHWVGYLGRKIPASRIGEDWNGRLQRIRAKVRSAVQPAVLWGAGGRGGNMLNFCNVDTSLIEYVVDVNPAKQGMYIPPYGQLVISPDRLREISPGTVFVASEKYLPEIIKEVPEGCDVRVLE
jgi:hypothetical protein